jgi:branched-chain amino acid transport system permease protein
MLNRILKEKLLYYLIIGIVFALVPLLGNDYMLHIIILSLIYVILASSLDVLVGYTGALSLGHAAFYAIGAYITTLLSMSWRLSPWLGLLLGGIFAMAAGLVLGIPCLRLRGPYLAISTLGFGVIIYMLLMNLDWLTRGPLGIPGIPPLPGFGILDFTNRIIYYYFTLILTLLSIFFLQLLTRSRFGIILVAIREDEDAARAIGVNVALYRLLAFMVATFFAGLAGGIRAHYIRYISPDLSALDESIVILSMTLIGGFGTIIGPAIGAFLLTTASETFRFLVEYRLLVYGSLIVFAVRFMPGGIADTVMRYLEVYVKKSKRGFR